MPDRPNQSETQLQTTMKNDWTRFTAPVDLRASELHDLLSCHHRFYGKGIHIPVSDVSQIKGSNDKRSTNLS